MDLVTWLRLHADRVGAAVAAALGLVAVTAGWLGVSREIYPAAQLPYLASGGVLGLVLIGLGATTWLSADLRDEWHRLAAVEEQLADLNRRLACSGETSDIGAEVPTERALLAPVTTDAMARQASGAGLARS